MQAQQTVRLIQHGIGNTGTPYELAHLECGHVVSGYKRSTGDCVACDQCAEDAKALALVEAIDPTTVHHARQRKVCMDKTYCLYGINKKRGWGFELLHILPSNEAILSALLSKGIAPLSPTEKL